MSSSLAGAGACCVPAGEAAQLRAGWQELPDCGGKCGLKEMKSSVYMVIVKIVMFVS